MASIWDNYQPATADEHYWLRIAKAAERIADHLEGKGQEQTTEGETPVLTQLREGDAATDLPDDYPGRDALIEAGYTAVKDIPTSGDKLTAISGIGTATANKILTYQKTNG